MPRVAGVAALLVAALLVAGCGSGSPDATRPGGGSGSPGTASGTTRGVVTVLAAASLSKPFTSLKDSYEAAHPGVTVRVGFGSSTTLAQQVAQGADADLVATAGTAPLTLLGDVRPTEVTTIARNTLEIATPPDDPAGVARLTDLGRKDVQVVVCAASVPCGKAAVEVLDRAGVTANVVSRELDVSATLAKVTLGEADAAIVYHSDVVSAGRAVRGVEIPAAQNVTLTYPLARFGDDRAAKDFAAYVAGPQGRAALGAAGFLAP